MEGYEKTETQRATWVDSSLGAEQDVDRLFSMLPMLEYLHLPVGVSIPQNSADKIAQGILLPSLRVLDASSPVGLDILDMVTSWLIIAPVGLDPTLHN